MEGPSLVSTAGVTDRIHGCDGMILLRGIAFRQGQPPWSSGVVHIAYLPDAYLPDGCVADLSTLVRIVDDSARRFPMQERLTVAVAGGVDQALRPRGVAVAITLPHPAALVTTLRTLGAFRSDPVLRREFHALLCQRS